MPEQQNDKKKLKLQIFRNETAEDFTKLLSDPSCKAEAGSASAMSAALASSLLKRAALLAEASNPEQEDVLYVVRNAEILRNYMVRLIDEDVRCHGPLRRALKEGGAQEVEASRQAAVSICQEIIAMMGNALELSEKLIPYCSEESRSLVQASAELALGAVKACVSYILYMGNFSTDETYRFVLKRENELTLSNYMAIYDRLFLSC